jgi:hypothetical protein
MPSGFVLKIDGRRFAEGGGGVVWSRLLGGNGDDALISLSAGMPGFIFVSGRSGSTDFPTTKGALYPRLEARNDSTLAQLRMSDGRVQFATFIGGTRRDLSWYNDEATGIFASASGDVYVTGCTHGERLLVTPAAFQRQSKGNAEPFVLRLKFAKSTAERNADAK